MKTEVKTEKKKRWPLIDACIAAKELIIMLKPFCGRVEWAGSVRRRKEKVGDIELLIVPAIGPCAAERCDLFEPTIVNFTERRLDQLLREGVLAQRPNVKGHVSWGPKIKLAIHVASGIPVDLFITTEESWWNYLVCRTGPKASNERICVEAQKRGWKWKPYSSGFCKIEDGHETAEVHAVFSERDVFDFVELPYREPHERK